MQSDGGFVTLIRAVSNGDTAMVDATRTDRTPSTQTTFSVASSSSLRMWRGYTVQCIQVSYVAVWSPGQFLCTTRRRELDLIKKKQEQIPQPRARVFLKTASEWVHCSQRLKTGATKSMPYPTPHASGIYETSSA